MVDFKKASLADHIVNDVIKELRSKKEFDQVFSVYEDFDDDPDELYRDLKAIVYRHLNKDEK